MAQTNFSSGSVLVTSTKLIERTDGKLVLPYKQSDTGQWKQMVLKPEELIRRFLQHVLPKGYKRVRSYGWFHPAARKRLNRVRGLLQLPPTLTKLEKEVWLEIEEITQRPDDPGTGQIQCRSCQANMELKAFWRPGRRMPGYERGPPTG